MQASGTAVSLSMGEGPDAAAREEGACPLWGKSAWGSGLQASLLPGLPVAAPQPGYRSVSWWLPHI